VILQRGANAGNELSRLPHFRVNLIPKKNTKPTGSEYTRHVVERLLMSKKSKDGRSRRRKSDTERYYSPIAAVL
jgi:hypothetical protein